MTQHNTRAAFGLRNTSEVFLNFILKAGPLGEPKRPLRRRLFERPSLFRVNLACMDLQSPMAANFEECQVDARTLAIASARRSLSQTSLATPGVDE
ncbi:hypothetical protein ONZ45_g10596 [Pleurotus djamor]|nr:hypothetical protein ONZ45_g10596 [Pleurotus djamor]